MTAEKEDVACCDDTASAEERTGEDLIKAGKWADCGICKRAFRRRRQTLRYCAVCKEGFCEGEHGNFAQGRGLCVLHGGPKNP